MKNGQLPPPKWMYEFSSLPNVAIPLSYFCIGIALQLLRTPLIVYFIVDQDASPADVNVLFTVSESTKQMTKSICLYQRTSRPP